MRSSGSSSWPSISYGDRSETCDTLHAHTQVPGKLAASSAAPQPQLLLAALRVTARGWETRPLPAPDGSGAFVVALDLHTHRERWSNTATGARAEVALTPNRPVGEVTRDLLAAVAGIAGGVEIDPTPEEVPWTAPLDEDTEHATYDPDVGHRYSPPTPLPPRPPPPPPRVLRRRDPGRAGARRPSRPPSAVARRRSTPGGDPSTSPSTSSREPRPSPLPRTSSPATRWTPRRSRSDGGRAIAKYPKAAFYGYAHPAPNGFATGSALAPGAHWGSELGLFALDWDDVIASENPHATALAFTRSVFQHACLVCGWDPELAASADGTPPPVS